MNDLLTHVLDAVTNPALAGSEAERVRERLAAAGILADPGSRAEAGEVAPRADQASRGRPDRRALARARRAAGHGTPLAELVTRERG